MLKPKNYDQESKKTKQILHYVMCNGNVLPDENEKQARILFSSNWKNKIWEYCFAFHAFNARTSEYFSIFLF